MAEREMSEGGNPSSGACGQGDGRSGGSGGGGPVKSRPRARSESTPLAGRLTVKTVKSKKEAKFFDKPLHVKILHLGPLSQEDVDGEGDFDREDFDMGEITVELHPRLRNRRPAILGDTTGVIRSWLYVDIGYEEGDCIRIIGFAFRLMRIVIHRKTVVQFNIPMSVPAHIVREGDAMWGTPYYPFMSLKAMSLKKEFVRGSLRDARICRISDMRYSDFQGEHVGVVEVYLDDKSKRMFCSLWRKCSDVPLKLNQSICLHDVIGKKSSFHNDAICLNVNYRDEMKLGGQLPEAHMGSIETIWQSDELGEIMLRIVDEQDATTLEVPETKLRDAFGFGDLTLSQMCDMLPLYIRVQMTTDGDIDTVTKLLTPP